jgi:DNA-binding transcriptional ArsR family regulator
MGHTTAKRDGAFDWCALVPLVAHPTKVLVIEALQWIGRPLSASDLRSVFDGQPATAAVSYHLKSLAKFGALTRVEKRRVRGTWKRLYVLSPAALKQPILTKPR